MSRPRLLAQFGSGILISVLAPLVVADNQAMALTPTPADAPPEVELQVEVVERLVVPRQPVRVRFLIYNLSDAPVTIPLHYATADDGVTLPLELALGDAAQPAVSLSYESDAPEKLTPPGALIPPPASGAVRIAPGGAIGCELDMQPLHRLFRYAGDLEIRWRPLDGRFGEARATLRIDSRKDAVFVTDYGKITCTLEYDRAPLNVQNFLELARAGFYDGKTIHKIVPGLAIQGGCPAGNGSGARPDGKFIPAEFGTIPFDVGTLAMARKPDQPDSASCQFFMTLSRVPDLDGLYTVIGQAHDDESLRTLQQIGAVPTNRGYLPLRPVVIRSVNLTERESARSPRGEISIRETGVEALSETAAPSSDPQP